MSLNFDSKILSKPTTADITDVLNKRFVTDDNLANIGNQSGTNTGDNAVNSLYSGLATSKQDTITLTTTGTSGAATLVGATLNIPQYSAGGGGGDMYKSTYDVDNTGVVDNAEAIKIIGRNSTGSTLRKGTVIYISGSTGNKPNFVKAKADVEATSAGTFGIIADDLANNSNGYALCLGYLDNLDTRSSATYPFTSDTLADGDTVYLSPTTAGYITNVKPSAPNHLVYIGKVTRTSPTNGTIVYRIQNGYELEELHNVAISSVADKQLLSYDNATSLWKNKSVTTADIADSTNKRYVTDANLTTIGNQSGVNTGDQDLSGLTPNTRSISTTTPLQGGGDLSANRTLSILQSNTSQSGYLSNTDWNTFNGKQPQINGTGFVKASGTSISYDNSNYNPIVINDFSSGSVTGTTVNTIVGSYLISANTFKNKDTFNLTSYIFLSGTKLGNQTLRFYFNSTVSLTGANLIATYTYLTTTKFGIFERIGVCTLEENLLIFPTTSSIISDRIASTIDYSTPAFPYTSNNYLIVAIQLANTSDLARLGLVRLTK